eukprot:6468563-Amphidinium_carterae.1
MALVHSLRIAGIGTGWLTISFRTLTFVQAVQCFETVLVGLIAALGITRGCLATVTLPTEHGRTMLLQELSKTAHSVLVVFDSILAVQEQLETASEHLT